jgi:NADPH:quinone reductase-like Zn-dependent oxidoreductase
MKLRVDVVLNSLGVKTWDSSFASVGVNGRLVTFGSLTGADNLFTISK